MLSVGSRSVSQIDYGGKGFMFSKYRTTAGAPIRRYSIWSILDLKDLSALYLIKTVRGFSMLESDINGVRYSGTVVPATTEINTESCAKLVDALKSHRDALIDNGLMTVIVYLDRQIQHFSNGEVHAISEMQRAWLGLRERIEERLESMKCFYIPEDLLQYHDQAKPLWSANVEMKLQPLMKDIEEAGKCIAVAHSTAAVFHLMRIMEAVVHEFGVKLGISNPDIKDWGPLLGEIDGKIRALPHKTTAEKAIVENHTAIAAHLFSVKTAWRNPTMHVRGKYDEAEAIDIFTNVRAFVRSFAELE